MRNLLSEFDPNKSAVINPSDLITPQPDFPKIVVSTFSRKIIEKFANLEGAKEISSYSTANGRVPIYQTNYGETPIGFYMSPIGSASSSGVAEELIAKGAETLIFFGSCGVLDGTIADGHIIIPTAALRDEGASYHYAPPSDEIVLDEEAVATVIRTMDTLGYPYVVGKTWTTDAFYRETPQKMEKRKESGCLVVEMECSALAVVAKFRGVSFAQFLYAADNLDSPSWEPRGLNINQGLSQSDRYMAAAFECGIALQASRNRAK